MVHWNLIVKFLEIANTKLQPGQIVGRKNLNRVVTAKWHDKRCVTMLSTYYSITILDTGKKIGTMIQYINQKS